MKDVPQRVTAPAADAGGPRSREPQHPRWTFVLGRSRWSSQSELAVCVEHARRGSSEAFEVVVALFAPKLYKLLLLRLPTKEDARDVLQETLCAAWVDLPRLRDPEKIGSWLAGIAMNKVRAFSRRPVPASTANLEPWEPSNPIRELELKMALEQLPDVLREVLLMRYVLGLSEREVARAARVRVGTVKSRTARARQAMIRALGEEEHNI